MPNTKEVKKGGNSSYTSKKKEREGKKEKNEPKLGKFYSPDHATTINLPINNQ